MDPQQALSAKAHLDIIRARIESLHDELKKAAEESYNLSDQYELGVGKVESAKEDGQVRRNELEFNYAEEIDEYHKQIQLAEEMLAKKKEERDALLNYLNVSNIYDIKLNKDLREFDWDNLKRIVTSKRPDIIHEQYKKATEMSKLNERLGSRLSNTRELFSSTVAARDRRRSKVNELEVFIRCWKETSEAQEKKISKMRIENDRLDMLIKQCVTSEPISEFVEKNVRDKCHSFLGSSSDEDLLNGLIKFKLRQERMIKLLKHKENTLTRDTNLLQVAKDQTSDQELYYVNLLQSNREKNLNPGLLARRCNDLSGSMTKV